MCRLSQLKPNGPSSALQNRRTHIVAAVLAVAAGRGGVRAQPDPAIAQWCMSAAMPVMQAAQDICCPSDDCDGPPDTPSLACCQHMWPTLSTCVFLFDNEGIQSVVDKCAAVCAGGQCGPALTPSNTALPTPPLPSAGDMYRAECSMPEVRCSSFRDEASCSAASATASLHWDIGAYLDSSYRNDPTLPQPRYDVWNTDEYRNEGEHHQRDYVQYLSCGWCECDGTGEEGTATISIITLSGAESVVQQACSCGTAENGGGFASSCNDFRGYVSTTLGVESRDHFGDLAGTDAVLPGLTLPGSNPDGNGSGGWRGGGTYCQGQAPGCHDFYANSLAAQCDQAEALCTESWCDQAELCTQNPGSWLDDYGFLISIGAPGGPQCSFLGYDQSPYDMLNAPEQLLEPAPEDWLGENGGCASYYDSAIQCRHACMDEYMLDSCGLGSLDFCPGSYTVRNTGPFYDTSGQWSCTWQGDPNLPAAGTSVPTTSLVWSCTNMCEDDPSRCGPPCQDDPVGTLSQNGFTCDSMLAFAERDCTIEISTIHSGLPGVLADQCPVSCGTCPNAGSGGGH